MLNFNTWNPTWAGKVLWLKNNTKLTQVEISHVIGVSPSSIWQCIRGLNEKVLEVTPDESARELYEQYKLAELEQRTVTIRSKERKEKRPKAPDIDIGSTPSLEQSPSSEPSSIKTSFVASNGNGSTVPTGMAIELTDSADLDIQHAINYVTSMIKEGKRYNFEIRLTEAG